jgi:hypothetical protein
VFTQGVNTWRMKSSYWERVGRMGEFRNSGVNSGRETEIVDVP